MECLNLSYAQLLLVLGKYDLILKGFYSLLHQDTSRCYTSGLGVIASMKSVSKLMRQLEAYITGIKLIYVQI